MKKKQPQDSTIRNVQAANKRIAALKKRVKHLEFQMKQVQNWIIILRGFAK